MNETKNCRCCTRRIETAPILSYTNVPQSAQGFVKKEDLNKDKGGDMEIYQCPYCGLVQILSEPVSYYRDVIRATSVSKEMAEFRKQQYTRFVSSYNLQGKKVLEIGAGCGEYMKFMLQTECEVYGLEHRVSSVESGKEQGLNMIQGFIEDESYQIACGPFQGFYTMNFLEHIPNPNEFLRGIYKNLSEDAVGLVEVPNFDMIVKENLYAEFICDHLSYFTKDTLKLLLEQNGFEVVSCEVIWYDYIISAVVKKRKLLRTEGFAERLQQRKESVALFFEAQRAAGRKTVVWGAGHQALVDLSLLNMKEEIEFVVDSAKFKQNLYTPTTQIPIYAPEKMKEGITAVLIMAAGYSDEIAKIVKEQYAMVECVAILRETGVEYV